MGLLKGFKKTRYVQCMAQCLPQSRCFEPVISFLGMHLKETMKHLLVSAHRDIFISIPFILACFVVLTSHSVPCLYHSLPQVLSSQALPGLESAGEEVWLWRCKKGVKSYHRIIGTSEGSLHLLNCEQRHNTASEAYPSIFASSYL